MSKALIDKERHNEAINVIDNGLKLNKNSVDLNFLKAKIYKYLNMENEYKHQIELLSVIAPDKIIELKKYEELMKLFCPNVGFPDFVFWNRVIQGN